MTSLRKSASHARPRLGLLLQQVYTGQAVLANGELESLGRPSMSKLLGSDALGGPSRMADTLQQVQPLILGRLSKHLLSTVLYMAATSIWQTLCSRDSHFFLGLCKANVVA